MDEITKRILRRLGDPDLVRRIVSTLSLSEIRSLMMDILDEKRKELSVREIFDRYERDGFVRPSPVDQTVQREFDAVAASSLPTGYRVIELSPVSPLGCCSQLAGISQDRIVSTVRGNEVCSDPTNVLAMEASLLRKRGTGGEIRLATSHRALRAERLKDAASFPHFGLFAACIAGRDTGDYRFETAAALEIIAFYDGLLHGLAAAGYSFSGAGIVVKFKDESRMMKFAPSADGYRAVSEEFSIAPVLDGDENWSYYSSMRMNLFVVKNGERFFIADAGDTDWTQKLLSNKKERFFISGFGSERFIAVFGTGRSRA